MCIHAKHTIYIRVVRQEEQQHLILLHKRTNERRSFTIASVSIKKYPISGIQCLNRERYSMEIAASFFYFYIHIYKMFCNILSFLILYFHNSLFSIISSTSQKKTFLRKYSIVGSNSYPTTIHSFIFIRTLAM